MRASRSLARPLCAPNAAPLLSCASGRRCRLTAGAVPPSPGGVRLRRSYAIAAGKYGATEEKGIYPEDVLRFYGATKLGSGPPALGTRSPRQSFDPAAPDFCRERGSYQHVYAHP